MRRHIAALSLSATLLVSVALHEGYTDRAVIPVPGDVPTLGHGTTRHADGRPVKMGDTTTPQRALSDLLRDLNSHSAGISKCITAPLHQHEFDAYSSLAYNIGVGAFCKSTLVRKLNAGDYAGACSEILRWNKVGGRVLRGLVNRRQAEYNTCVGPQPSTMQREQA